MDSFRPLTACASELQLLSNGNYHVMVTSTGAGPHAIELPIAQLSPASPAAERAA